MTPEGFEDDDVSSSVDHRARRVAERRDRVLRAAIDLFVEKGFDATTMDDIAERADVARASVFNYYPRKTSFIDEWSERRREQAALAVEDLPVAEHGTREMLTRYLVALASVSEASRLETVTIMKVAVHSIATLGQPLLATALQPLIERGQEIGDVRADIQADRAALLIALGYFGTIATWVDVEPAPFDLGPALVEMVDLVLGGVLDRAEISG